MPLLWVLGDLLGLTGTKFSCGMGLWGSCTVLIDGEPMRSCVTHLETAAGKGITTIEGLSPDGSYVQARGAGQDPVFQREPGGLWSTFLKPRACNASSMK